MRTLAKRAHTNRNRSVPGSVPLFWRPSFRMRQIPPVFATFLPPIWKRLCRRLHLLILGHIVPLVTYPFTISSPKLPERHWKASLKWWSANARQQPRCHRQCPRHHPFLRANLRQVENVRPMRSMRMLVAPSILIAHAQLPETFNIAPTNPVRMIQGVVQDSNASKSREAAPASREKRLLPLSIHLLRRRVFQVFPPFHQPLRRIVPA